MHWLTMTYPVNSYLKTIHRMPMELKGVKIVPLLTIREHACEYMYIHIIQTYIKLIALLFHQSREMCMPVQRDLGDALQ